MGLKASRKVSIQLKQLIAARSRLPALTPWSASSSAASQQSIDPQTFNEEYLSKSKPGLFRHLTSDVNSSYRWPAIDEWPQEPGPLGGLRKIDELQRAVVDVEIARCGHGYCDGVDSQTSNQHWTQIRMPFNLFQDAFIDGKIPWSSPSPSSTDEEEHKVGYVAQQDLFDSASSNNVLLRQCPILPHTLAGARGEREQWRRNVWIGGAGTFTPIHCDPYENVFAQVVGRKRVHLFPPHQRQHLYMFDHTTRQSNTSRIPSEAVLLLFNANEKRQQEEQEAILKRQFPLFFDAIQDPDARHVVMEAGDALYIPKGWFHCIASLSISASVNSWFR